MAGKRSPGGQASSDDDPIVVEVVRAGLYRLNATPAPRPLGADLFVAVYDTRKFPPEHSVLLPEQLRPVLEQFKDPDLGVEFVFIEYYNPNQPQTYMLTVQFKVTQQRLTDQRAEHLARLTEILSASLRRPVRFSLI